MTADDEVALLLDLVKQRYGERLDAAQLERIRDAIGAIVKQAHVLRAVRLRNEDAPWPPFVPYRGEP
jgi:hypothetical protein